MRFSGFFFSQDANGKFTQYSSTLEKIRNQQSPLDMPVETSGTLPLVNQGGQAL